MKVSTRTVIFVIAVSLMTCSCSREPAPSSDAKPTVVDPAPNSDAKPTTEDPTPGAVVDEVTEATWTPLRTADYPDAPTDIPADLPATEAGEKYVVLAWNDLGMHCFQPDFSKFQVLPPYNVYWAQVVERGQKPAVATDGLQASYRTLKVDDPATHTNFWQYAGAYGWDLERGVGLKGLRTAGDMKAAEDHFVAEGVPVVDFSDDGAWNPFPFFLVSIKDTAGETVAETLNVAPVSTEMACDLCHVADSMQGTMESILKSHDEKEKTELLAQAESGEAVMCSSCHADPAMGANENKNCQLTLSAAMHGFHAKKLEEAETPLPKNHCHACHPGPKTNCLRDVMSRAAITCTNCHGTMEDVADPARVPWVNMPSCLTCHTEALADPVLFRIKNPNEHLTPDAASLYRHSKAHGGGVYCAACHGSPHAVTPTSTKRDNEQAVRLQGHEGPINQCTLCHLEKPEEAFWHFRQAE